MDGWISYTKVMLVNEEDDDDDEVLGETGGSRLRYTYGNALLGLTGSGTCRSPKYIHVGNNISGSLAICCIIVSLCKCTSSFLCGRLVHSYRHLQNPKMKL